MLRLCARPSARPASSISSTASISLVLVRTLACSAVPASASASSTRTLAVLGGGITGLTSALVLARRLPKDRFRIVLVEKQDRLGGWVQSDVLPLSRDGASTAPTEGVDGDGDGGKVAVVEGGPRSIRPRGYSGMVMLDLVRSLGLAPRLLSVPLFAPAARNRYIYYPDRLHRLASSPLALPKALLTSPPLQGVLPSLAADFFTPTKHWNTTAGEKGDEDDDDDDDESIDAFLTRRFGGRTEVASNLVSAVLHGIYAGDARLLSVRALLPALVRAEQRYGAPIRALLPRWLNARYRELPPAESRRLERERAEEEGMRSRLGPGWDKWMRRTSVYSFPRGIQEVTDAMARELGSYSHVEMRTRVGVDALTASRGGAGALDVRLSDGSTIQADRVISTIPAWNLVSALQADQDAALQKVQSLLKSIPSVTVAVVNIVIPSAVLQETGIQGRLLAVEGFGFLIPRSTPNNEDGILGVVFDSDTFPEQDEAARRLDSMDEDAEEASQSVGRGQGQGQGDDSSAPLTKRFVRSKAETTKLTVMLGGHWFDKELQQERQLQLSSSSSPSEARTTRFPPEEELRARALRSLERHLCIPRAVLEHAGTRVVVRLQRGCIPQYVVGHVGRMRALHRLLLLGSMPCPCSPSSSVDGGGAEGGRLPRGSLVLAGASYTGVSVNDCVAGGERVASRLAAEELEGVLPSQGVRPPLTGLEKFAEG